MNSLSNSLGAYAGGHDHGHEHGNDTDHSHNTGPTSFQVWGIGLGFVTLINLCAALGVLFLPLMGKRVYKFVMSYMIALAVGTLVGSSLMILLPEALQLEFFHNEINEENSTLIHGGHDHGHEHEHEHEHGHEHRRNLKRVHYYSTPFHGQQNASWEDFLGHHPWYVWRTCVAFVGIYMFYLMERVLREFLRSKTPISSSSSEKSAENGDAIDMAHGHSHMKQPLPLAEVKTGQTVLAKVQPVAWMIIVGDGLHNLVDGLGIGAAFSNSLSGGIGISLAVLAEELPHELGDFAILLAAGMSVKMALMFNLLSATLCYVGFIIGVVLGELPGAAVWIFAIAAGMFLYIALTDMLPEMNQMLEDSDAEDLGRGKILLLQNLGLFTGFGIMLLLALFSEDLFPH